MTIQIHNEPTDTLPISRRWPVTISADIARIIVPLDTSAIAERALPVAEALATSLGVDIELF